MLVQPVTVNLPVVLYDRLRQRAEQAHTTVEEELIQAVATAVPVSAELDSEMGETLSQLALLDDEALRRAAHSRLAEEVGAQLERLHLKRQREGLTAEENQILNGLLKQFERAMLVRAQAAALLKRRGQDVTEFRVSHR